MFSDMVELGYDLDHSVIDSLSHLYVELSLPLQKSDLSSEAGHRDGAEGETRC